ncbi:MAG TPA: hypothetical protein VJU77_08245 [Chthoniobacterales bacterium]|nr:hypothetical protein [Chthoniobacterales bacterium]
MNTLLAGVCVFIPLIGQIVIKGWLITGFWGRDDQRAESFGGAFRLRTAQRTVPASAAKS